MKNQVKLNVAANFQHANPIQLLPEVPRDPDKDGSGIKLIKQSRHSLPSTGASHQTDDKGCSGEGDARFYSAQSIVGRPRGGVCNLTLNDRRYSPDLCTLSVVYFMWLPFVHVCACVCVKKKKKGGH